MKSKTALMTICAMTLAGCLGPQTDALFRDVSKAPPQGVPAPVVNAIATHRPLAEWIVYQSALCDLHGCVE